MAATYTPSSPWAGRLEFQRKNLKLESADGDGVEGHEGSLSLSELANGNEQGRRATSRKARSNEAQTPTADAPLSLQIL